MHDYSIDKHPKEKVLFVLALLAIILAPTIQELAERIVNYLEVHSGWSSAPAVAVPVFGVFAGLYCLFNTYLWRLDWLRKLLLVPDLNGTWQCVGKTVLKDAEAVDISWEGTINVTQSWSKMSIYIRTEHSHSRSISASIFHEKGIGYRLLYQYNNEPHADELDLEKHSGSAELMFSEDATIASGHYFTDRHRTTVGTISLKRRLGHVSPR
jgi:hypothetical protein